MHLPEIVVNLYDQQMAEQKTANSGLLEIIVGILLLVFAGWLLLNTATTYGANPLSGAFAIVVGGLGAWAITVGRKKRQA